jgi:hypothetical protein
MNAVGSGIRSLWEGDGVRDVVELLAGQERLHVFVGAGVSKEAGLPSWSELLDVLLRRTALTSDPFRTRAEDLRVQRSDEQAIAAELDADAASYSRWIIASHGLMGAAAVVKAWLGEGDYGRFVQEALYAPVTESQLPLQPGPTAIAVASLWRRLGPNRMTVITTNYDRLIERALEEVGVDRGSVRTVTNVDRLGDGTFNVVHLHGVLAEPQLGGHLGDAPDIVLAEDEFFGADAEATKRSQFCEAALSRDSCLFVGTSFTDPNLLGYLYAAASRVAYEHQHVAIMVKQGEQPPQLDASLTVLTAGRQAAAARLARVNVTTLQPNFFSQTAHVLGEIEPAGPDHLGFVERLDAWSDVVRSAGILPVAINAFNAQQPRLQNALSLAVDQIQRAFGAIPSLRCEGEVLSLHLWVHDPLDESIVFIARSDQQFLAPALLEREPIDMPIRRLVVEAVCSGTVLEASGNALGSSRWNSMLVVPLNTAPRDSGPGAPPIPIGAVVLASSADATRGLSRLRAAPTARHHLVRSLSEIGEMMLNPGGPHND